jgi:hypothetical protein
MEHEYKIVKPGFRKLDPFVGIIRIRFIGIVPIFIEQHLSL